MTFGLSGAALAGIAIGGAGIVSGVIGSKAAGNASGAQVAATDRGIAAQQEQFAAIQKLLQPFVSGGTDAFNAQQNLIGLNGSKAQKGAINGIATGPEMAALIKQGENGILQNASATGGLRGGNTQGALAEFRPQMLAALLQQQYSRLGGLSAVGQNAAAGTGIAGQNSTDAISLLMQQQGAARAGGALAQGQAFQSIPNALTSGFGAFAGLGGKF